MRLTILAALPFCLAAPAAAGGEAEVVDARASRSGETWRFDVTLRHADEGWDHYADAWEVRLEDGTALSRRTLLHPHVEEQPFTRSLTGVEIPDGVGRVHVHARDSVHGWSDDAFAVDLER